MHAHADALPDAPAAGREPAIATSWLMWGVPALLFLVAFFHRSAPGVMAKGLMETFGAGAATVGLLSATYFYAYAGFMVPAGVLIDALGPRRVVTAGGAVMGLGTLAMAVAAHTPLLFAGRFVVGAGASVTFIGALKIAASWFPPSRFGFLAAVTASVGVLGALTSSAPLAALVALLGWRAAFAVVGTATVAAAILCAVVVRDRPARAAATNAAAPTLGAVLRGMLVVLGNRHTWPPFLGFFCLYSALGNLYLWVVPCLRDVYRLSNTEAAVYATAPSLALLVSAPLTGFVSDRVLRRRKLPYAVLAAAQCVLWALFVATLGALPLPAVYAVCFALGVVGASFVLTWPLGREVNPPHLAGIAVAVVNLGGFIGAAITQGPLGALLDARWTGAMVAGVRAYPVDAYRAVFGVCGGLVLVATLLSAFLRETRAENVYAALRARS